ncbi:MAG: MBOAT family protein [Peptococcaceae bacterium]|nr:MBOAT family protein [Peptococcaceae bacterium]
MSITSNLFLTVLVPAAIIISVLFRKNISAQNRFLLLVNIIFILFAGIGGFALLFATCVLDYFLIRLIQRDAASRQARFIFGFAILLNIAPLLLIKYTGFFLNTVNSIMNTQFSAVPLAAPLGISFYTFQAVSLLADVKTQKITHRPKFSEVFFYLSFFVTISSGPIVRFNDISKAYNQRFITADNINDGVTRFSVGVAKKVLLANNLAVFADKIFSLSEAHSAVSMLGFWMGSAAFTLQLYLDFSGYSDMVIGLAKALGFSIPENFDYPYTARTIQDFWRRWHISLSRWFRDYIYIPLGGNRVTSARHILNLLVVWLLTGIWHGANWTFIFWGFLYFSLLVFEKYCKRISSFFSHHFIGHIYTLFFVNLLWVFFRANSIQSAWYFVGGMFGINSLSNPIELSYLHTLPFLILCFICSFPLSKKFAVFQKRKGFEIIKAIILSILLILSIISISSSSFTPFIYGQF